VPSIAEADYRGLSTHRNLDNMPMPAISRATAIHTINLAPPQILLQGPKHKYQGRRRRSRRSNHKIPTALSTPPSTSYPGPTISCIPARAISVPEVYKWQQQPSASNPNNTRSRRTLACPQRCLPPARRRRN